MAASSLQLIPTEHINSPACNASPIASSQSISEPVPMAAFSHEMFTVVDNVITSVDFDKLDSGGSTVPAAEIFRVSANEFNMHYVSVRNLPLQSLFFIRKRITGMITTFSSKLARPMLLSLASKSVKKPVLSTNVHDLGKTQPKGITPPDLSAVVASLKSFLKGLNWLGTRRGTRLRRNGISPIGMF